MADWKKYLEKVPDWAVKVGFLVLVVIFADMYFRQARALNMNGSVFGFVGKDELQKAVIWQPDSQSLQNYEYGTWVDLTKSTNCEPGSVVTGVSVIYGGTCKENCAEDGGVVKQIQLTCTRLITEGAPEIQDNG